MKTVRVTDRSQWRSWLKSNGATAKEIWLVYYKKSSGKIGISQEVAVEEALCFGWIDGVVRKIDDDCFCQRFTPRRPASRWSKLNIARVRKLIRQKRMTKAGLAVFSPTQKTEPQPSEFPEGLEQRFRAQPGAWKNFLQFPPYYRKMTIGWVASAKKEGTQLRRLQQLIECCAENRRINFM